MKTSKIPLFLFGVMIQATFAATGFQVSGTKLLDANGNEFIMRGINHPYVWFKSDWATSVPAMAAAGANTVRVVMSTGKQWSATSGAEITAILSALKQHKMIAVLEVHDCTGYGDTQDAPNADPLSAAVNYWKSADVKAALVGQEAYAVINIANEPFGNNGTPNYVSDNKSAIQALRNAGYEHTIMVDAANWGQDWSFTMRDNAAEIFAADSKANTIFSVHMYDVFDTDAKVASYLDAFKTNGLALVVGEFAADHFSKPVAAQKILSQTVANGQGYIGWSWKGNSSSLTSLDIALTWDGSSLSSWGDLLVNNTNGLKAKAQVASIFAAGASSSTPVSSSILALSSSLPVSSSSATAVETCGEFVNGVGGYGEHCYSSGLSNMAVSTCYTLNPDRGTPPAWINADASDAFWWRETPCGTSQSSSSTVPSSSSGVTLSSSLMPVSSSVDPLLSSSSSVPLSSSTGPVMTYGHLAEKGVSLWQNANAVHFRVPAVAQVRWVLSDLVGHEIATGSTEAAPQGLHSVDLSSVRRGVYVFRITWGSAQKVFRVKLGN